MQKCNIVGLMVKFLHWLCKFCVSGFLVGYIAFSTTTGMSVKL